MGQPITTNPFLIAAINMTVVFAVLYGLSLMIRLITLIDPTQKKKTALAETSKILQQDSAAVDTAATTAQDEHDEMMILFTAAIAAYGHSGAKIVAIRPVGGSTWSQAARMEGVSLRNGMF